MNSSSLPIPVTSHDHIRTPYVSPQKSWGCSYQFWVSMEDHPWSMCIASGSTDEGSLQPDDHALRNMPGGPIMPWCVGMLWGYLGGSILGTIYVRVVYNIPNNVRAWSSASDFLGMFHIVWSIGIDWTGSLQWKLWCGLVYHMVYLKSGWFPNERRSLMDGAVYPDWCACLSLRRIRILHPWVNEYPLCPGHTLCQ